MAPLKNYTILALSNLLSANVDAGLKYSFSMGYHEDTRTRSAFMEVLTNILNQGTEFETLADTVMTDRYEKVIDVSNFHASAILQYLIFAIDAGSRRLENRALFMPRMSFFRY